MATLNYSRSQRNDIHIDEDRKLEAVLDVARSDGANVAYATDTIVMQIYDRRGGTLVDTLTSGVEITLSEPDDTSTKLTFNKIFTDLTNRSYHYFIFNSTLNIGLSHGKLIVE